MDFSVTILGSSSAMPTVNRCPSAQLVSVHRRSFLVDCGEGTQLQLLRCGLPIVKIDRIFISHLHGDHLFGIFGLMSTLSMMGRREPLHIYAPGNLQQVLDDHLRHFGDGMAYAPVVHCLSADRAALAFEDAHVAVSSFPLRHRVPACGFLFQEKAPQRNIRKEAIAEHRL
ncbi:MAG: MBL fold metallo-hydrolase, partial [Prevotellaceae bacterium]|nr:MBL fold metallo-hydrolase [Prevotellaceae bacterium]